MFPQELDRRVEERTADLEFFVRCAAHDLRAPLRAINGYAQILRQYHSNHLGTEGRHIGAEACPGKGAAFHFTIASADGTHARGQERHNDHAPSLCTDFQS